MRLLLPKDFASDSLAAPDWVKKAYQQFSATVGRPDFPCYLGTGALGIYAGAPTKQKTLISKGFGGGQYWDRTSDLYRVKVALSP